MFTSHHTSCVLASLTKSTFEFELYCYGTVMILALAKTIVLLVFIFLLLYSTSENHTLYFMWTAQENTC